MNERCVQFAAEARRGKCCGWIRLHDAWDQAPHGLFQMLDNCGTLGSLDQPHSTLPAIVVDTGFCGWFPTRRSLEKPHSAIHNFEDVAYKQFENERASVEVPAWK